MPGLASPIPFVGREDDLRLVTRILSAESRPAIVNLWGVPGIGKSSLCSEAATRALTLGMAVAWLDLEVLLSSQHAAGLAPETLARGLASAARQLHPAESSQAKRMDRAFDAALKGAATEFYTSHSAVVVRQRATHGAQILDTRIQVNESVHRLMVALQQYKHAVARAIQDRFGGHDLSHSLLVVDTTEVLYRFDDRAGETNMDRLNFGIARWFCADILEDLCASTGLKLVLSGRERMTNELHAMVPELELAEWSEGESREFGVRSGLAVDLASNLYSVCHGVPLWTGLVVEVCNTISEDHEPPTPQWLRAIARARPAEHWLPEVFLQRLDDVMRDVVVAAAVPRVLTREAVHRLLEQSDRDLDDELWQRFCHYSFTQLKGDLDQALSRRSMHPLVRTAILASLSLERPTHLKALHRRAAAYFAEQSLPVEEFYHVFAAGDVEHADRWEEMIEDRVDRFDFEHASRLVESALSDDHAMRLRADAPSIEGHALLWRARIFRRRDQVEAALFAYREAIECFRSYGATVHEIESWFELSRVEWRSGDLIRARDASDTALRLARVADAKFHTARILETLGALPHIDRSRATEYLAEARRLYRDLDDDHNEADVIIALSEHAIDDDSRLQYYDEALQVFAKSGCPVGRADILRQLAAVKASKGLTEEAFGLLDEAETLFRASNANEHRGEALQERAYILANLRRYPEARELLLEVAEIYRVTRHPVREAGAMRQLAVLSTNWLGLQSAFDFLAKAAARSTEIGDVHGAAASLEVLGDLQQRHERWPLEKDSYEKALEGFASCSDWSSMIRVWQSLAHSASKELDLDLACDYIERAFKVAEGQRPAQSPELALSLGSLYLGRPLIGLYFSPWEHIHPLVDSDHLARSEHWYGLAESRSSHGGSPRVHGLAKKGLADVAVARQDFGTAISLYEDAAVDLRTVRDRLSVAWLTQAIADCYLELGRDADARPLFAKAMSLFDETNETWL